MIVDKRGLLPQGCQLADFLAFRKTPIGYFLLKTAPGCKFLFACLHIFRQNRDLENFWEGEPYGRSCCCGRAPEGQKQAPFSGGRGAHHRLGDPAGSVQPPGSLPDLSPEPGAPDAGPGDRPSGRGKQSVGPHHRPPATRPGDDSGSHPPGTESR